jgi:diguanylate cyclase (GGDEF)-like protein
VFGRLPRALETLRPASFRQVLATPTRGVPVFGLWPASQATDTYPEHNYVGQQVWTLRTDRRTLNASEPRVLDRESESPSSTPPLHPRRQLVLRALERRLALALEQADAAGSLGGPLDLVALLPTLPDLCSADSTFLYVSDAGRLICAARFPSVAAQNATLIGVFPEEAIEQAVAAGCPAIIEPPVRSITGGQRQPDRLVLPVVGGGVMHGAIVLQRRKPFSGEDLTVMTVYTALVGERITSAARAAHLARQQHELEQHLLSQRRLLEINERLLSNLDPGGVLDLIADSLKSLIAYDNLTIYRLDASASVLRPVLSRDRFAELIMTTSIEVGPGITGWVLSHGTADCVNDAHLDPRSILIVGTPLEAESLIVVPLRVGGEVVGTLNIGRMGEAGHFSPREFELVQLFAGQASIALANVEAQRALWTRAETDALTGLRNRGAFEMDLERLLCDTCVEQVLLLMLDVDHFKLYNDRYGHPIGDQVLRAVGAAIAAAIAPVDGSGYRYGGDEFALIVPGGDSVQEKKIRHSLATGMASISLPGEIDVSVSIGAAFFPEDASTRGALIAAADKALYLAKNAQSSFSTASE